MKSTKFKRSFMVSALCLLALACTGNDARKCKITPLSNGDVRMMCPGGRTILLPAGRDAEGVADDCEAELNGDVLELSCGGSSVDMGACGLGFAGDLLWGASTHPSFPGWDGFSDEENHRNLERFEELGCTRVLGTLYLNGAEADGAAPLLSLVEHVETVRVLAWDGTLSMPELLAAHVEIGGGFDPSGGLDVPKLRRGGLTVREARLEGALTLPALEEGVITLANVEGLASLNLPALESGRLSIQGLPQLATISLPLFKRASLVDVGELSQITRLDFPALEWVDYLSVGDNGALEELSAPVLREAPGVIEIYNSPSLVGLSLPNLRSVSRLGVTDALLLGRLNFPSLTRAATFQVAGLPNLSSIALPLLASVSGELHLVESGQNSGIDFTANSLVSLGGISLERSQFTEFRAPLLRTTNGDPIEILESHFLVHVEVPRLEDTGLAIETAIAAVNTPIMINISKIVHDGGTGLPGAVTWPIRLTIAQGQAVDIDFSEAQVSVPMLVEVANPRNGWDFHSGFSNIVRLENIPMASTLSFRRAANLREIHAFNVGSRAGALDGVFGTSALERAEIVDSTLQSFWATVSDESEVIFIESLTPLLKVEGAPTAAPKVSIDLASSNVNDAFLTVESSTLEAVTLRMTTPANGSLVVFDSVRRGIIEISSDVLTSVRFPELIEGEFELAAASIEPAQIQVPAVAASVLTGTISANWVGVECPSHILSAWPNVSLAPTGCH